MRAEEFACTIGFDALRISMGGKPRHHDVETICRWLQHVSAQGIEARSVETQRGSVVGESPVTEGHAPDPSLSTEAKETAA